MTPTSPAAETTGECADSPPASAVRQGRLAGSRRSVKRRIQALGILVGLTLVSAAFLGLQIFTMTESARMAEATTQLNLAMERMARHYELAERSRAPSDLESAPLIEDARTLRAIALESLADLRGLEGGFYASSSGRLHGYAFPTYSGSGPKTDIPEAERPVISRLVGQALATKTLLEEHIESGFDAILFAAAPLLRNGEPMGAVWVMHRLPGIRNPQWRTYNASLIAMLAMAGLTAGLAWLIARSLDRAISKIVVGIQALHAGNLSPAVATSYEELDRVVGAINHLVETVRVQQARREHLERQLHQADRLATLGRLVAGVAHEVRNPLSSIRLKLQLARRGTLDVSKLTAAFDVVEQEISRLDRLVARLLSVAKPSHSECLPTHLQPFLKTLLQPWQMRAWEDGIVWEYRESVDQDVSVTVDRDRLSQILDNLLTNAMEAMSAQDGRILVTLTTEGQDRFSLTIRDSGSGIPPEHIPHLFEPFFTTKPQGTGLGLFLSAEIARAMGGSLTYVDSPDGGGQFRLILPCSGVDEATDQGRSLASAMQES